MRGSGILYFADHKPDLARLVRRGRKDSLKQVPSIASPGVRARLAAPDDPDTFERSKLDWGERERLPGEAAVLLIAVEGETSET